MTIREAIDRADALKPNACTEYEKVNWLNELDGKIFVEVMQPNEGTPEFHGYTVDSDKDTVLLVPAPYDDLYISWLHSMIDFSNREIVSYNNTLALFNAKYSDFKNYWNRTRMPIGCGLCYFGSGRTTTLRTAGGIIGKKGEEIADPLS